MYIDENFGNELLAQVRSFDYAMNLNHFIPRQHQQRTNYSNFKLAFPWVEHEYPGSWLVEVPMTFAHNTILEGMPKATLSHFKIDKKGGIKAQLNIKATVMAKVHHKFTVFRHIFATGVAKLKLPSQELQDQGYFFPTLSYLEVKKLEVFDENMQQGQIQQKEKMSYWTIINFGIEDLMEHIDPTKDEDSKIWQKWFEQQVGVSWDKGTVFRDCSGQDLKKFNIGYEAGNMQASWYTSQSDTTPDRSLCPDTQADFSDMFEQLNAFNRLTDGYYEWLQSRDMALPYEVGARFWQNFVQYDPLAEEQQEEGIKEDL